MARENGWGITRILGELKKLGVGVICRSTIRNILRENGFDPGPKRGVGTWDEFIKIHAATLWQCDFFLKRVITHLGIREMFVLVFIHVQSRRIYVSPGTQNPNDAWVQEQASAMLRLAKKSKLDVEIVLHDRDSKFTAVFDAKFSDAGAKVQKSPIRSPNIVAYVERVIQTLQCEVLDYFYVFGEKHLIYIVREAVDYYLTGRRHQGLENELILPMKGRRKTNPAEVIPMSNIGCKSRLGGLLKHYYRKAA